MKIEMLEGEHLSGATHSTLDFVGDDENSVLARDLFQPGQEIRMRDDVAALALDRLDNDRRDFARVHSRLEDDVFQVSVVSVGDVSDAGNKRTESFSLDRFR